MTESVPGRAALVAGLLAAVFLWRCNSAPCTNCPPLEGAYLITFTNATASPGCATLNRAVTPGTLTLAGSGSQLGGTFNGAGGFTGIVDPSGNFNVESSSSDGGSNLDQQQFHGEYFAALTDGGTDKLFGTYNARFDRPANSLSCTLGASFSGARQ